MMNFTNIDADRLSILLNNVLVEIVEKTGIADNPDSYIPWLKEEVGMTDAEIEILTDAGRLPMPDVA